MVPLGLSALIVTQSSTSSLPAGCTGNLCRLDDTKQKLDSLTFEYTGVNCEDASTGHLSCNSIGQLAVGDPLYPPIVCITVGDGGNGGKGKSSKKKKSPKRASRAVDNGETTIGNTWTVSMNFGTWTEFELSDCETGALLSTVEVHTSCSKPLAINDEYGPLRIAGYATQAGLVVPPAACSPAPSTTTSATTSSTLTPPPSTTTTTTSTTTSPTTSVTTTTSATTQASIATPQCTLAGGGVQRVNVGSSTSVSIPSGFTQTVQDWASDLSLTFGSFASGKTFSKPWGNVRCSCETQFEGDTNELFRSVRWTKKNALKFTYTGDSSTQLLTSQGRYTLILHFADIFDNTFNDIGSRTFDIYVQNQLIWTDYDIFVQSGGIGGMKAARLEINNIEAVIPAGSTDLAIEFELRHKIENPLLNAFEILHVGQYDEAQGSDCTGTYFCPCAICGGGDTYDFSSGVRNEGTVCPDTALPITTEPTPYLEESCESLGWPVRQGNSVCGATENIDGTCNHMTETYADAKATCSSAGARLCSAEELQGDIARGTGCRADASYVWTSTSCIGKYGGDGILLAKGKASSDAPVCVQGQHPKLTDDETLERRRAPVRCCASSDLANALSGPSSVEEPIGTFVAPPVPSNVIAAPPVPSVTASPGSSGSAKPCNEVPTWQSRQGSSVCAASKVNGECHKSVPFKQAMGVCSAAGGRLCSASELRADTAKGTGCNLDRELVWSSSTCGARGFMAVPGSSASLATAVCSMIDDVVIEAGVRCCADDYSAAPPIPTAHPSTTRPCKDWCEPHVDPWSMKCGFKACVGCDVCETLGIHRSGDGTKVARAEASTATEIKTSGGRVVGLNNASNGEKIAVALLSSATGAVVVFAVLRWRRQHTDAARNTVRIEGLDQWSTEVAEV